MSVESSRNIRRGAVASTGMGAPIAIADILFPKMGILGHNRQPAPNIPLNLSAEQIQDIMSGKTPTSQVPGAFDYLHYIRQNPDLAENVLTGEISQPANFDVPYYMRQMEQKDIMKARRQQQELEPYTLGMQGFKYDESGKLVPMGETERIGFLKSVDPLAGLQYEQQLKAMRGEIPVSPALERDITEQDLQTREALARRLGAGYETSTGGGQALARMGESANIAREAARRGELGEGFNTMQAYKQGMQATPSYLRGETLGMQPYYGNIINRGMQEQQFAQQQAMQDKQLKMGREAAWLNLGGTVAGAIGGYYLGGGGAK